MIEKEIKLEIANYFLNDSRQYLRRYELLKPMQTEISNRSKLLIDIVFSFECSLKALIFIESSLDEKETNKLVRKCGHDLRRLIQEVDTSCITEIVSTIDENSEHFFVSCRYTLDANIYFRNSTNVLSDRYYSTIADSGWLERLYQNSKNLHFYVLSKLHNPVSAVSLEDIDIKSEQEKAKRIRQLASKK